MKNGEQPATEAAALDGALKAGARRSAQIAGQSEESLTSAGQREISLIWEKSQRHLSIVVIYTGLLVGSILAVGGKWLGVPEVQLAAVVFLFGISNLVVSAYFHRTNSSRVGGVGGDTAGERR